MADHVNGFDNISRPCLIGVGGGTASGKSSVCSKIMEQLGQNEVDADHKQVHIISMESFYKPLSEEQRRLAMRGKQNFDHPGAFNDDMILRTLQDLKSGKTVQVPVYDTINYTFKDSSEWNNVPPADVILFEGILPFYFREIRKLFDMKLFVDTDADTRLSRRLLRDVNERGRDLDQILYQYTTFVKPAFEEFCLPTKKYADVIIPRGADNQVAIDLIVQHIQDILRPDRSGVVKRARHSSDSLLTFRYSPPH